MTAKPAKQYRAKGGAVATSKSKGGGTKNLIAKAENYAANVIAKREGLPLRGMAAGGRVSAEELAFTPNNPGRRPGMARGGNVNKPPTDPKNNDRSNYKGQKKTVKGMAAGGAVEPTKQQLGQMALNHENANEAARRRAQNSLESVDIGKLNEARRRAPPAPTMPSAADVQKLRGRNAATVDQPKGKRSRYK